MSERAMVKHHAGCRLCECTDAIEAEAATGSQLGLDALRPLSEAATPGPWKPVAKAGDYTDLSDAGEMVVLGADHLRPIGDADTRGIALAKASNAAFIVAAVNYVRDRLATPATSEAPDR